MPSSDDVLTRLGDKVTTGLGDAIDAARDDLAEYGATFPGFVAEHSARGLANWIHDRIWARAKFNLDDVPEATFIDRGPTHDLWIGMEFRIRSKRHNSTGAIRAYPTVSALDFISQEPDLFGISTLNLTVGYEWGETAQQMGAAVISLRNGSFDEASWVVALPTSADGGSGSIFPMTPTDDAPSTPTIDVHDSNTAEGTNDS